MENTENSKKSSGTGKWVILFVISFLGNGYLFYEFYQNKLSPSAKSLDKKYADLQLSFKDLKNVKDGLEKELETARQHLEQTMSENSGFQSLNDELRAKVDEQTLKIRDLLNRGGNGDPAALLKAKAEIEKLKQENASYIERIAGMEENLDMYSGKLQMAEEASVERQAELARLKARNDSIQKSLSENSLFQVQQLKIEPVRTKKGKDELEFKAGKVERLKVSFMINAIDIAEKGEQEIVMRVIGTNNEVLTNDNDVLTDSDQLITDKKIIQFTGNPEKVKFSFSQKSEWKKGTYEVEILHKGQLINMGSFVLQ